MAWSRRDFSHRDYWLAGMTDEERKDELAYSDYSFRVWSRFFLYVVACAFPALALAVAGLLGEGAVMFFTVFYIPSIAGIPFLFVMSRKRWRKAGRPRGLRV